MSTARVLDFPESFNLAAFVREYVAASNEPNPHRLAEEIYKELTPEQIAEALRLTLPAYVRTFVGLERNPAAEYAERVEGPSRLKAVAQAQAKHPFHLRWTKADGTWDFYENFTREDLDALIGSYRARASQNYAKAKQHSAVKRLMDERKALRVGQLDAELVKEIFNA